MVDFTGIELGRQVATPDQVFSVIRAELRFALIIGKAQLEAARDGRLAVDEDLNLTDGGDDHVETAIFTALLESALGNVKDWARDMGFVYDGDKLREFVRQRLIEAGSDRIEWGEIDY